ncbi:lytic transglycosylase domain-containing protein [Pseudomonas aeruginosa]|uniref:lytic transglycosylase domain-containing protein n=1 Tax=Pseudomonas aeruginosa TaxID=287 RepID=UPI0015E6CB87|nr:lytic transglycosylase domain-containing protein [Pseudomonas aeruginosa]
MLVQAAILTLAQQCAPNVAPHTMDTLVQAESSGNPYAIGVVGMELVDQPKTKEEAIATAKSLMAQGAQISGGLGQVFMGNWEKLGLTVETVFEPCPNLKASGDVLSDCYNRAIPDMGEGQSALQAAFSCYYSNNFSRGFVKESPTQPSYVMRIAQNSEKIKGVPAVEFKPSDIKEVDPGNKPQPTPAKPVKALEEFHGEEKKQPESEEPKAEDDSMSWDVLGDFK